MTTILVVVPMVIIIWNILKLATNWGLRDLRINIVSPRLSRATCGQVLRLPLTLPVSFFLVFHIKTKPITAITAAVSIKTRIIKTVIQTQMILVC